MPYAFETNGAAIYQQSFATIRREADLSRFTADEEAVLRRYVTNLDQPVFALVNLPEVVKGALFARY